MNKPRTTNKDLIDTDLPIDQPGYEAAIERDFGSATAFHGDSVSRRRWLQIMGASLALGGTVGCRYQEEKIAPFAFRPQNRTPGIPQKYSTSIDFGGVAQSIVSTNYDGRPIKLDGNPDHPDSMGASTAFTQARILEFYDPDRLRTSLRATDGGFDEIEFDEIVATFQPLLSKPSLAGVAVLARPSSSPSLIRIQKEFTQRGGSWFTFAPINDDNTQAGLQMAFGKPLHPHYKFDQAKIIVSVDADPLMYDRAGIANSIGFAKGRDPDHKKMNRLYAIESQYSATGAAADHRLSVRSSKIPGFVAALKNAIKNTSPGAKVDKSLPYRERVLAAVAQDLIDHQGSGIIIAGENQAPEVHAMIHDLNQQLNNNGKTVVFTDVKNATDSHLKSIQEFAAGDFETVIVLGGNPVYDAPRSLDLGQCIGKAKNSLHVSIYKNETSLVCKWISNQAHELETWKDGYSGNGSILVGQPLINPLFGGKSAIETFSTLMKLAQVEGQAIVRETLNLNEADWKKAVHDGFVEGSEPEPVQVTAKTATDLPDDDAWCKPWDESSLEVVFTPSDSVYDGEFANNSWMQEVPDFFTKISWDNVAKVSPKTAAALGMKQGTLASFRVGQSEPKQVPICIQPGQADGSIGMEIGFGRTAAGRVGGEAARGIESVGHDINNLRSLENWLVADGIPKQDAITSTTQYRLAVVQEPWEIDETGRDEIQARMFRDYGKKESDRSALIREGSFESYLDFLSRHPQDHTAAKAQPKTTKAVAKTGSLPVLNNVSFVPEEKEDHDDHGHGSHKAAWPEAFHMHHELFDLTPGTREDYAVENAKANGYENLWGMSIDLNKCIGCNACVVACQSENNIPVVGKDDVWRGREMHWLRIDRYYGDNLYTDDAREDDKVVIQQPVTCHHCENAPCETVCPVAATVHSSEGLNDMVYNRCIGTRYCGNNCPYKVRRFNFFNYSDAVTLLKYPGADKLPPGDLQLQSLMMNPEVTVRSRGVMEKCTFCVQRIQNTKIQAKNEKRAIGPNEITTACQDACPTGGIYFGDLANSESNVAKAHANSRAYTMLEELNNRPRLKYLAKVRNVHPALLDTDDRDSVGGHGGGHGDSHASEDHSQETAASDH